MSGCRCTFCLPSLYSPSSCAPWCLVEGRVRFACVRCESKLTLTYQFEAIFDNLMHQDRLAHVVHTSGVVAESSFSRFLGEQVTPCRNYVGQDQTALFMIFKAVLCIGMHAGWDSHNSSHTIRMTLQ